MGCRGETPAWGAAPHIPKCLIVEWEGSITDNEFNQTSEQVFGNGAVAKFRAEYVMVVAG